MQIYAYKYNNNNICLVVEKDIKNPKKIENPLLKLSSFK